MIEDANKKPLPLERGHAPEADPTPPPLTGPDSKEPSADQTEGSDGGGTTWLSNEERKKRKSG